MVTHVTDATFTKEVSKAKGIVVADFWAEWCGPCKIYGPIFEQVANENASKAKFVKINVEEANDTAAELGVQSIPTTIIFKDGEPVERHIGLLRKEVLVQKIASLQ